MSQAVPHGRQVIQVVPRRKTGAASCQVPPPCLRMLGQENGGSWDPELTGRSPQLCRPCPGHSQPCLPVAEWGAGSGARAVGTAFPAFTRLTLSSLAVPRSGRQPPGGQHS